MYSINVFACTVLICIAMAIVNGYPTPLAEIIKSENVKQPIVGLDVKNPTLLISTNKDGLTELQRKQRQIFDTDIDIDIYNGGGGGFGGGYGGYGGYGRGGYGGYGGYGGFGGGGGIQDVDIDIDIYNGKKK